MGVRKKILSDPPDADLSTLLVFVILMRACGYVCVSGNERGKTSENESTMHVLRKQLTRRTNICITIYIYIQINIYICVCIYVYMNMHINKYIYIYMYVYIYICIYIYIIYIYIYIHV